MIFWTKVQKSPQNGCFSPKSPPEDVTQSFARVDGTNYTFITTVSANSAKSNERIKSYKTKSVVLDDLGAFGGIFDPFWAPGDTLRVFPQIYVLQCKTKFENTFCRKISGKSNGRFTGNKPASRTHGRD